MGFLGIRWPRFGLIRLTKGEWFKKQVQKSFDAVDVDKDGELDKKEIFIGLLQLYDQLNSLLPCHIKVPTIERIDAMMAEHDVDASGKLAFPEYLSLCQNLVGASGNWRNNIPLLVTRAVSLKVLIFPLSGWLLKKGINRWVTVIPAQFVPRAATEFVVEAGYKAVGGVV